MANIIDYTYLINEEVKIPIPNKVELRVGITDSINLYEGQILKHLLGYKMWKEMKAAYDASLDAVPVPLITKWANLINGAEFEFEYNGKTYFDKWIGLKNTQKQSLIANYVYFFHRRYNISQYSSIGETISNAENSRVINPYSKLVNSWNKMIEMYGETGVCSTENTSYIHWNEKPSAYNFMLANISDYPDWKFTKLDMILSPLRRLM